MKKIALFLSLVLIASAAFAATPAAKKSVAPAASASSGVGFTGVTLTAIGCPAAHFGMGSWSLDAGGSIASIGNQTSITLLVRGNIPISSLNDSLDIYWAPQLMFNSAGGGSTTTLSLFVGAEYMFAPQLSLFADLTAFSLTSAGGTTTWVIGQNFGQIYTGGRLYL